MFTEDDLDQNTVAQILEARAQALAQPPQADIQVQGTGFVVLQLANEKYGIPIECVHEIRPVQHLTRVPSTPSFYAGIVNLRGHLYPVLDVRRYLGLNEEKNIPKSKLVLASALGVEICILADSVLGIQWIAEADIQPLLIDAASHQRNAIRGVTTDLLTILDLDVLFSDPKLVVQDQAAKAGG